MRWLPPTTIVVIIIALAGRVDAQPLSPPPNQQSRQAESTVESKVEIYEADVKLDTAINPTYEKGCCGYPLSEPHGFALRFYWLAIEERYWGEAHDTEIYTPRGMPLGRFPAKFVRALQMEGSGILEDGRVLNVAGRCRYGSGTCFEAVDVNNYPFGRGAGRRHLVPFKSVAVDRRLIALGEPLYIPELDGLPLPDGSTHDGCVRADDVGGNIKQRKLDFFVIRWEFFRILLTNLYGVTFVTPRVESPHCQYLRQGVIN